MVLPFARAAIARYRNAIPTTKRPSIIAINDCESRPTWLVAVGSYGLPDDFIPTVWLGTTPGG